MDKITLWEQEEYQYPLSCGFIPNMRLYIHEDDIVRPCILIAPGGGYCVVSPSEGEIVAKKFYDMGYQAAVVTYTTNLLMSAPLDKQPMMDLMRAIRYVRKNAESLKVNKIILCGFSAGAHAVGTVGVHFDEIEDKKYPGISARPDALILSYPVITSGEYAHRDSFNALLGFTPAKEDLDYMSLEKHVSENTPPCFIWQTATDELVPVKNSYLFANALQEHHIPYSLHIFSKGPHGLSLADETWANEEFGEPYTLEQTFALMKAVEDDLIPLPDEVKQMLLNQKAMFTGEVEHQKGSVWEEIKVWPELVDEWLKGLK